jgi:thiamine biosynthesis lipoprotein
VEAKNPTIHEKHGRIMATNYHVVIDGPSSLLAYSHQRLTELEQHWSRFLPQSDISQLNNNPGKPVKVSPDTFRLVDALRKAWRLTAGRFDPTQLPSLISAGYTSSIDNPDHKTSLPVHTTSGGDLDAITMDQANHGITLPAGMSLDPGGLGKGFAADLLATELLSLGATSALVNLGGDLRCTGNPPQNGWVIEVKNPVNPSEAVCSLSINTGGVATSSTLNRRLGPNGERHHQIDPATGQNPATDIATVTVITQAAWMAESLATAALQLNAEEAIAYLNGHSLPGVVIDLKGIAASTENLDLNLTDQESPA